MDDATNPKIRFFCLFFFFRRCISRIVKISKLFALGFFHSSQVRNNFDKDNRQSGEINKKRPVLEWKNIYLLLFLHHHQ